jgi:RHH-type transcriptional regulator, rel operon repressor / antitoxin RelB
MRVPLVSISHVGGFDCSPTLPPPNFLPFPRTNLLSTRRRLNLQHLTFDYSPLYLYSEAAMLAIRLPQSIEKRLEKLARRTGRTKTFYVREAILEHLDDLEDLYLAEKSLDRIQKGEEQTVPLEELLK